ncbi:hypothetical protein K440DRAFT_622714 [Wilcoxina mikolae CBS 423.85]|nr:hypothetical protein K440DRAFT_622714 [Wilcoxina mikolae CBS 423.85]
MNAGSGGSPSRLSSLGTKKILKTLNRDAHLTSSLGLIASLGLISSLGLIASLSLILSSVSFQSFQPRVELDGLARVSMPQEKGVMILIGYLEVISRRFVEFLDDR